MRQTLVSPLVALLLAAASCGVPLIISASPAFAQPVANTTYYVSPSGSDSNSGTSTSSPWKTLAHVDSLTFQPGDQILFQAGGSWTGTFDPSGSGSANAPILVGEYGSGSLPALDANLAGFATVSLHNQQYWEIRDLDISNDDGTNPDTGSYSGVDITAQDMGACNHIYLQGLDVHDIPGEPTKNGASGGILLTVSGTTTPTWFNDVLIDSNKIEHVDWAAITSNSTWNNRVGSPAWTGSTNVWISNNYVDVVSGDGIIPLGMIDPIIENNYVGYAHYSPDDYAVAIWPWSDDQATFRYNEAAFTVGTQDSEAFDMDGQNNQTLYEYNYSHDNQGGALQVSGNLPDMNNQPVFRDNISQNDSDQFVALYDGSNSAEIYNNDVYVPAGTTQAFLGYNGSGIFPENTLIADNIYDNQGSGGGIPSNVYGTQITYNNLYGQVSSALLALATHTVTGNPQFVSPGSGGDDIDLRAATRLSGYELQSSSPDIGAGLTVTTPTDGAADFWGHLAPSGPTTTIGAMQYGATATGGLQNADFNLGTLQYWSASSAIVSTSNLRSWSDSVELEPSSSSYVQQTVSGLSPGTTYTFSGYGEVTASGVSVDCGAKNYDPSGAQVSATITTLAYAPCSVTFTTGPAATSAVVFFWNNGATTPAYGADFNLAVARSTTFQGGTVYVENDNSSQVMDDLQASGSPGAPIGQWPGDGAADQQWTFTPVAGLSNTYTIQDVSSGDMLDVSCPPVNLNPQLVQCPADGSSSQEWQLVSLGSQQYNIKNVATGNVVDVSGGSQTDGAAVIQWQANGGTNQEWQLVPAALFTGGEAPFGGTPAAVPGMVQAANYDTGGQGVAYNVTSVNGTANSYRSDGVDLEATTDSQDTTGTGSRYDMGWTASGQWFHYTVNVATARTYTLSLRLASPSGITDALHIANSSGTNLSGNVNAPATGGWQTWTTVTVSVTLPTGTQTLTVQQDNGGTNGNGWNIHFLSFT